MTTVMEVLQELRIDLQDFAWLVAQQLRIDSTLIRVSEQVFLETVKLYISNKICHQGLLLFFFCSLL